jgi:putative membrane protein
MMGQTLLNNVASATAFSFLGILVFIVTFAIVDALTPYALWKEIVEDKNTALAILIGALSLGICIIIASAIH